MTLPNGGAGDPQNVLAARAGSSDALDRLLFEYRPLLRSLADRQAGPESTARGDASDIVQEVLLYVARRMSADFQGSTTAEFEAWLRKVVRSKVIDARRHNHAEQRDVRKATSLDESAAGGPQKSYLQDDQTSPSQHAARKEQFERAIAAIPAQNRDVVRLHLVEQLPLDDIAKKLAIEPEQCALRYHRGLRSLKRHLRSE
jgi:RNA polymerase sigma-70 factor (subfamily 1)